MNHVIEEILKQIFEQTNRKHDAHYEAGQGVLIVPEGYVLHPRNVVLAVSEGQLFFMSVTGVRMNVQEGSS